MDTYNLPKEVVNLVKTFNKAGFEIYIVGGAVRDLAMGKVVTDWDFTTNAIPEEILKLLPDGFYNNSFGTVGYKIESFEKPFEITTYRTEHGYSDSRRPDKVLWGKTLKEDVERRDFTVNAMALTINGQNEIKTVDYFEGLKDIKNKNLKAVGNPDIRFQEDALRMLRAVRIAGELKFKIDSKTLESIKRNASLINKIAKERIKDEFFKILGSDNPYLGILHLKDSGLMQEIIPEFIKCFGVEQKSPNRHHIYDVGTHLLMSLKECKNPDPVTRFAVLIHDIGKPQTYKKLESGIITFYNHEMVSTRIAQNIAERLRLTNNERDKLIRLVRFHQFTVDEHQTDSAVRRFITNVGKEYIYDMLDLRTADRLGSGSSETSWRFEEFKQRLIEVQKQPFSIKDLKVNGRDVMEILNIPSGPEVGVVLEKLLNKVVEKEIPNQRNILINKIKTIS